MTLAVPRNSVAVFVPAAASALALAALDGLSPTIALLAVLAPAAAGALVLWPWAALPTAIIGGTVVAEVLGVAGVASIVAVHVALIGTGFAAVALRRGLDPSWPARVPAAADVPMTFLAVAVVVGSAYGLAAGNDPHAVLVAANALGAIPAYYFLATITLTAPAAFRAACALFAVGAAGLALAGLTSAGRHGGLFSALALPATLTAAAALRTSGPRRLLILLASVLVLDVLLSAYRTIWLAAAVALVLILVRGTPRIRATLASVLALALVIGTTVALVSPGDFERRLGLVPSVVDESAGYRLDEARIGWASFAERPLVGRGLGQSEGDRFVGDLGLADVGPVYHAFYVTVAANSGLIGLVLLAGALAPALRRLRADRGGTVLAFGACLLGFTVAASFSGPADGHWELGLLAALVLLADRFERPGVPG